MFLQYNFYMHLKRCENHNFLAVDQSTGLTESSPEPSKVTEVNFQEEAGALCVSQAKVEAVRKAVQQILFCRFLTHET